MRATRQVIVPEEGGPIEMDFTLSPNTFLAWSEEKDFGISKNLDFSSLNLEDLPSILEGLIEGNIFTGHTTVSTT